MPASRKPSLIPTNCPKPVYKLGHCSPVTWTPYQGSSLNPQLAIWRTRLSGPFLYLAPRNGGLRWRKTIDCRLKCRVNKTMINNHLVNIVTPKTLFCHRQATLIIQNGYHAFSTLIVNRSHYIICSKWPMAFHKMWVMWAAMDYMAPTHLPSARLHNR